MPTEEIKNQNINEITKKRIAEAIKKVSEENKINEEVIKKELLDLLTDVRLYTDRSLSVINELDVSSYDLSMLQQANSKRDSTSNLEEIMGKKVQEEINLERNFRKFLKEKNIETISIPEKLEDLEKIPPLRTFPPEIFENYIVKISKNLDKVPFDVLEVWVPEIIEIMGSPPQIPLGLKRATRLLAPVQIIVEWEVAFHEFKKELYK